MTMSGTLRRWLQVGAVLVCLAPIRLPGQEATASLAGIVVTADHPAHGLRRAEVTLTNLATSARVSAIADDQGKFVFARLRPGSYELTASKAAYLATTIGASQQGRPGTPLVLTAGQHVADVIIALQRGGVVTGTVRDITGAPVANLSVTVTPVERAEGRTPIGGQLSIATREYGRRMAVTDDRGYYRIFGLLPGDYVVAALPGAGALGTTGTGPRATIDGTTTESRPTHYGYAPVFHPGTPMPEEAAQVRVAAGEERGGIDVTFDLVRTVSIEGTVFWPDPTPGEVLRLSYSAVGPTLPGVPSSGGREVAADGRFTIVDLRPGRYFLTARVARQGEQLAWATTEVLAPGGDVSGVTLTLQQSVSMSGRVVFEGLSGPPLSIPVLLRNRATDAGNRDAAGLAAFPTIRPDGTFVITGIVPGRFNLTVQPTTAAGRAWWLKSAVAGDRDLLDAPLEFTAPLQDVKDAVLTVTDRRTELTGRLQTAAGQPATEYFVIVFSANRAHWFPGARRTRAVRPASDGAFSVTELPAGPYLVAAVTDAVTDEWRQSSFLEQLAPLSVPVTVPDGSTVRQDLQIAR
jgi:protocatechuate 3,4-dioxygenase beta subunit